MERFDQTYKYKLIYIFSMPYETHKGLLKIGEATLKTDIKPEFLVPNCHDLNQAAKARIDGYTATASVKYTLLYTELARKYDGGEAFTFNDKDVHKVLMNSGIHKVQPNGETGDEWFQTTLDVAKNAIKAVKEGKSSLSSNQSQTRKVVYEPIDFREEQKDAVEKTIKTFKKSDEMLWYAKMRFGKTLTALEVVRRMQFRRVIIVTHRPVVSDGWGTDFKKIFYPGCDSGHEYTFECKTTDTSYVFNEKTDYENDKKIQKLDKEKTYFIYFASIQDLRGSQLVGGNFNKNNAVFSLDWDLIIIDEAHEGTQTELGDNVIQLLRKKNTKVLALSGTPFNLLSRYDEENVYTWDYVMEQKKKNEWDLYHHGDHNPYADLPKMHIFTYDLGEKLKKYVTDEYESKAFNFREFFRVWVQGKKRELPKHAVEGKFVHENDVKAFLDLMVKEDVNSVYPFSTQEYRDMFQHTLWMVPGVKEAKALSELLRNHPVFSHFGIANVAGEGDTYEEEHAKDALELVRKTIKENKYSITLSCGKLTTGVTVKEWTAVLMLSGSYSTAAAQYMQTIFRVQSAGSIDGRQKTDCFVFDFAPDRTLKVLTEAVQLSRKPGRSQQKRREAMKEFLNFCPVIAISGSKMTHYSVNSMMEQIKQIYAERAVNSGFDDESIYNDELLKLDDIDASKFNNLRDIIGSSKASKKNTDVVVNGQGLTDEQIENLDDPDDTNPPVPKPPLTPEEIAERLKKKQAKEARKKAIDILRGISIRMPLMIYGADVPLDEDIDIDRFVALVDDKSWEEFMPFGVTKKIFNDFVKYYDRDVFIAAGKRIRKLAAAADKETPTRRVKMIAEIFSHFKNPDKETVLTPWRVVNMHMSDTIGGWCFFNEEFEDDQGSEKHRLEEPRFVDRGGVTADIFREDGQTLEINSKTGLYPLYVTYSYYKQKLEGMSDDDWEPEDLQYFWNDTIINNIFVICKTPMAKSITARTLRGFGDVDVNAHYFDDLVNMLKNKPEQFKKRVLKGSYWKKEVKSMKFDAIIGNPPYQVNDGGNGASASPIYQLFVEQAKNLEPDYVSMITPSRWFSGGKGLDEFRNNMLTDKRIQKLVDYVDNSVLFTNVLIAGGVSYFLWNKNYDGKCEVISVKGKKTVTLMRDLSEYDIFIRNNESVNLIHRIQESDDQKMDEIVYSRNVFGIPSNFRGTDVPDADHSITLFCTEKSNTTINTYIRPSDVLKENDLVGKYKVIIGRSVPRGGEVGVDPEIGYRAITTVQVLYPGAVFTDTYLLLSVFDSEIEAINFAKYMTLKLPRFLLHETYSSMNITKGNFRFVPYLDYSEEWTDKRLFERYKCSDSEIDMVVRTMRPLEYILHKPGGAIKESLYGLDETEYRKMLNSSYGVIVKYLLKKYGKAKHDYFKDTDCNQKNPLVSRAAEGLYCHHIDEDKAILLSNDNYAKANPFGYQKASRLVYCNLLEHLLLHVKIAAEPKADGANENELQGIGGAINFICKELNDIYAGKEYKEEWRKKVADAVKDSFDDYILILKYLWQVVEKNTLYKALITKESLCVGFDGKVVPIVLNALISDEY